LADVLPDQRVKYGRQVEFMILNGLLLFRALLTQVLLGLLALNNTGEMDGCRVGTQLTFHVLSLRQRRADCAATPS
jgi:hypothetical protein